MSNWETILTAVLAGVGGSALVVGALAAWLGSVWKDRITRGEELSGAIDVDLREKRLKVYPALWKATDTLPKWPRNPDVTYEDLARLVEKLRRWYFNEGGMFLSRTTQREGYAALQDELAAILKLNLSGRLPAAPDGAPLDRNGRPWPNDHYERVRQRCSILRSLLTEDIASRRDARR